MAVLIGLRSHEPLPYLNGKPSNCALLCHQLICEVLWLVYVVINIFHYSRTSQDPIQPVSVCTLYVLCVYVLSLCCVCMSCVCVLVCVCLCVCVPLYITRVVGFSLLMGLLVSLTRISYTTVIPYLNTCMGHLMQ